MTRILSKARSNAGFTLIEMMIALLIFGIGAVAMAQVLPRGIEMRDRGRRLTVATALAQEQLELLRSVSFADGDLAAGAHADPSNPIDGAYNRTWTVTNDSPIDNMKEVEVVVTFVTAKADDRVTLTTLIAR